MSSQEKKLGLVRAPGEGAIHTTPYGDTLKWKTGEAETEGGYSLHERTAPPGSASTPHTHQRVIEAFYVIDGELEFQVGEKKVVGKPGSFVLAPKGVLHAWRNAGNQEARVLVLFTPSVQFGYFEEIDRITRSAQDGRPDPGELMTVTQKYGMT